MYKMALLVVWYKTVFFHIIFPLVAMQLKEANGRANSFATTAPREEQPTAERANDCTIVGNLEEYNYQYYEEYKRLYSTAFLLSIQLKQLSTTKEELWVKLNKLEKKTQDFKDDIRGEQPERKKRFRRTAQEIQRKYVCEVQRCQKNYGSEGSLQQHIKLKHPELYAAKMKAGDYNEESNSKSQQI